MTQGNYQTPAARPGGALRGRLFISAAAGGAGARAHARERAVAHTEIKLHLTCQLTRPRYIDENDHLGLLGLAGKSRRATGVFAQASRARGGQCTSMLGSV